VPRRLAPLLLVLPVLVLATPARAATPALDAGSTARGWVSLAVTGDPGSRVDLAERVGSTTVPLRTVTLGADGTATVPKAARWRCDRRTRTFTAGNTGEDTVTTPSCARRLSVRAATVHPHAGRRLPVAIDDSFRGAGARVRICLVPARGPGRCRAGRLTPNAETTRTAVAAPRPGRWTLRVTPVAWTGPARERLRVRPRAGAIDLVATGDSMIQIIDGDLKRALKGRAKVRSDAHISTGISKPSLLNWPVHAARQARRVKADVTVMFLGANDGFNFAGAPCCGAKWIAVYATKVRGMMRAYARGGAAQVYWLMLPAPRSGRFRTVFVAVNTAILRAAKPFGAEVRLLRMDKVFTPGYHYRAAMPVDGRVRRVRQGDGVHLNTTGAALAARFIRRALRADGIL
jgi:lysophospholipase L1-like esterase